MKQFYLVVAFFLLANAVPCVYQALRGPTIQDTMIAVNIINTKAVVVMLLLASFFGHEMYLDISFVFAFLYFVVVYGTSRYIEVGGGGIGNRNQ